MSDLCADCGRSRWSTVHIAWQSRLDFHFYRPMFRSVEARHETEPDLTIRHDDDDKPCRACGRPATYPQAGS